MSTSTKKALAIVWLVLAGLFGGLSCMGLVWMSAGIYDPVAMDGVPPDRVPFVRARFIFLAVAAVVSGVFAFRYVRRKTDAAS